MSVLFLNTKWPLYSGLKGLIVVENRLLRWPCYRDVGSASAEEHPNFPLKVHPVLGKDWHNHPD